VHNPIEIHSTAARLGLDFVPSPRPGLVTWPIEGEMVIVDPTTGQATVLNGFAAMIWGCLDGRASLGELVPDVAYAFDVPAETVTQSMVAFGRDIDRAGLLGDSPAPPEAPRGGLIQGGPGRRVLLANWNSSCGYCGSLAPELATLAPALKRAGVDLVLLASGDEEVNVAFLDRYQLEASVVLRSTEDLEDPFPGIGTPAAYLVGEDGVARDRLAVGAVEVAQLARRAAGQPETTPAAGQGNRGGGPRYLSAAPSGGTCAPGAGRGPRRTWTRAAVYDVGGFWIGVRADCEATDELLRRALAAHRVATQAEPPVHLSVVLGGPEGALSLLLVGDETVVRSRSPRRVLGALATYLSVLVDPEAGTVIPDGLWAVTALPTIFGNTAVLLPESLRGALAAARLARPGFRLVDMPRALIDPVTATLVVPPSRVQLDEAALDGLPDVAPTASEGAWVPPGRYPLTAWALGPAPDGDDFTTATTVATAFAACTHPHDPPEAALARLTALFGHVAALALSGSTLGDVIGNLAQRISITGNGDTLVRE
jgi:hypothetical protein